MSSVRSFHLLRGGLKLHQLYPPKRSPSNVFTACNSSYSQTSIGKKPQLNWEEIDLLRKIANKTYSIQDEIEIFKRYLFDQKYIINGTFKMKAKTKKKVSKLPRTTLNISIKHHMNAHSNSKILALTNKEELESVLKSGATYAFDESEFSLIPEKDLNFNTVVCKQGVYKAVVKDLARYLGPMGMMPSIKNGMLTENTCETIQEMKSKTVLQIIDCSCKVALGSSLWPEDKIAENIVSVLKEIYLDISRKIQDGTSAYVEDVVLTAPYSPAMSLNMKILEDMLAEESRDEILD